MISARHRRGPAHSFALAIAAVTLVGAPVARGDDDASALFDALGADEPAESGDAERISEVEQALKAVDESAGPKVEKREEKLAEPAPAPVRSEPAKAEPAPTPVPNVAPVSVTVEQKPAEQKPADAEGQTGSLLANPSGTAGTGGLHLMFSYYQSISNGAFVANYGARDTNWSNYLLLQPSYGLTRELTVALRTSWNYEFTNPALENGRRFSPDDWALVANYKWLSEKADGFGLIVGPRASIPISYESRFAGRITSLSFAAIFSRTLLGQFASLTLTGSKTLNRWTAGGVFADETDGGAWGGPTSPVNHANGALQTGSITAIAMCRPDEVLCASAGQNANVGLGATLLVAGALPWLPEEFSYYVQLGLRTGWNYARPVDAYTPAARDVDGQLVADGSGRSNDLSIGSFGASYQATEMISVDLWFSSFQPILGNGKDRDPSKPLGRGLRFPLWDFSSLANNFSSLGLGVSGSI